MPIKHIFTPKICHLCGRPIVRATYVRLANMGEHDQRDIPDARRESIYFHHHCYEGYRKEQMKRLLSPSDQM